MGVETPIRTSVRVGSRGGERTGGLRLGAFSAGPRPSPESGGSRRTISSERLAGLPTFSPFDRPQSESAPNIRSKIIMPRPKPSAEVARVEQTPPVITRRISQGPERFSTQDGEKTFLFGAFPPPAERERLARETKKKSAAAIKITILPKREGAILETKSVTESRPLEGRRMPQVLFESGKKRTTEILPPKVIESVRPQTKAETLPKVAIEATTAQRVTAIRDELAAMQIKRKGVLQGESQTKLETAATKRTANAHRVETKPQTQEETKQKTKEKKKTLREHIREQAKKMKKKLFVRDEKADYARIESVVKAAENELEPKRRDSGVSGEALAHALSPELQPKELQSEIIQSSLLLQILKGGGADGSLVKIADRLRTVKPLKELSQVFAHISALVRETPAVRVTEDNGEVVKDSDVLTVLGVSPNPNPRG